MPAILAQPRRANHSPRPAMLNGVMTPRGNGPSIKNTCGYGSRLKAGTTVLRRAARPLLRRGVAVRPPDITRRITKTLDHHRRQVLGLAGHAGAGAHGVAVLGFEMRRRLAALQ